MSDVAVVGFSCRVPGAKNSDKFWQNLRDGVESISHFRDDELETRPSTLSGSAPYVPARSILDGADLFDAALFGIIPNEAKLIDPQHRVFLECCWAAVENAGYDPTIDASVTGVFAGASTNTYLLRHIAQQRPDFLVDYTDVYQVGEYATLLGSNADMLATRVAYKLNLKGPAFTIHCGCSTSLVAVCQAMKSLQMYECDMALAGGVSITFPQKRGYVYQAGGMVSPDGHCRAFDADAQGTVFGHGVGVVVLKRLQDAVEAGDHIAAVIKGGALNNDGGHKIGFTAPSIDGQAQVISMAQAASGVDPATIGYVEAHGTGTPLGDPIEFAALLQSFSEGTDKRAYCALGTAKTNIGHLDVASGVIGLIKTVLSLEHRQIPPLLHFHHPNPQIDLANSPFYIATELREWPALEDAPRRAGVSAFGVGGTNAHVVVEEAPEMASGETMRPRQVLTLSARSSSALDVARASLADHLSAHPEANLADVAYTLSTGRHVFEHRWSESTGDVGRAIEALQQPSSRADLKAEDHPALCFLFAGQGAQSVNMALGLFRAEPVFRRRLERCAEILHPHLGLNLLEMLYPAPAAVGAASTRLKNTTIAQPAIFSVAYSLAQLWESWGICPRSMVGHSVGEFVAACLAGVMTLEDALGLVAARGAMMGTLPEGAMLSVRLSESKIREYLNGAVSLAALNAPSLSVVAGPEDALAALDQRLQADGIPTQRLHTSHAFHSEMMEPIVAPFADLVASIRLQPPLIPFVSTVTGRWITEAEATNPEYWAQHLRLPVRFSEAVQVVRALPNTVLLDIGPGTTMQTLARQHPTPNGQEQVVVSSLPAAGSQSEGDAIYRALGLLWEAGVQPDWPAFYHDERRLRVPLPSYPFERKRFWIESPSGQLPVDMPSEDEVDAPPHGPERRQDIEQSDNYTQEKNMSTVELPVHDRMPHITTQLIGIIQDLSGLEVEDIDPDVNFLELGFDSLFLTQVTQALVSQFSLRVTFGQLLDELPSIAILARYIDDRLSPDPVGYEPNAVSTPEAVLAIPASVSTARVQETLMSAPSVPAPCEPHTARSPQRFEGDTALERILQGQLDAMSRLMEQQLQVLLGSPTNESSTSTAAACTENLSTNVSAPSAGVGSSQRMSASPRQAESAASEFNAFGPYKPIQTGQTSGLTAQQEAFLLSFTARYCAKTTGSKQLTQEARPYLADPRVASGFRQQWTELVYPIVTERSSGSRLWDVDGNEYIDLVNGFGPIAFGHRPGFIVRALERQISEGYEIGPQTRLAGEVANLICKLTGIERVTFCNTGSEATMAALRVSRTVTGRQKVVIFAGSYHGTYDEVLVKNVGKAGTPRTMPLAPGIPRENVQDMVVLDYGAPESLQWIRENIQELAAVMVEPVQSRHPHLQPRDFLHSLRVITSEGGCALILDEVITGFRVHPGGIQALWDIKADLVTYGKVLAGGMPIGALGGTASFMDALDGGIWQYGDDSFPEAGVTFFAGTFVRHPLALAAARAVLEHLEQAGPDLQERLNARTAALVERLNTLFEAAGMPTAVETFASWFYFSFPSGFRFGTLFYYFLREQGVHIQEGFPCFLSTAHSDEDIERVYEAFVAGVADMRSGDFLSDDESSRDDGNIASASVSASTASGNTRVVGARPPPVPIAVRNELRSEAPITEAQLEIWLATQLGPEASCAYNEGVTIHLNGALDIALLTEALVRVVARHDALRATFTHDGTTMQFHSEMELALPMVDLSLMADQQESVQRIIQEDARTPFDLVGGPLVRAQLLRLAEQDHVLLFTSHHIICDGWSANVILEELGAMYSELRAGRVPDLAPAASFGSYALAQRDDAGLDSRSDAEQYWIAQFTELPPLLDLPVDRPRPATRVFDGATVLHVIPDNVKQAVRRAGAKDGATLLTTLLAAFDTLLFRLTNQRDVVVGVPAAMQPMVNAPDLVGHCVNLLPLRAQAPEDEGFTHFLRRTRAHLLDAYEHQNHTYGTLIRELAVKRAPARLPLLEVQFNLEKLGTSVRFDGLEVEITPTPKAFVNFDLFLNIVEMPQGLAIHCDYNTHLFDEGTIQRWLGHFQTVLEAISTNIDQTIDTVSLMNDSELHEIVDVWNSTSLDVPPTTIHELFEAQVERTPDAVAAVFGKKHLTYRELNVRANQIARRVRSLGIGPETVVGLCMERSPEMLASMIGILKAGGAYCPLDPTYPSERLTFMLEDVAAPLVVTTQNLAGHLHTSCAVLCTDTDTPWATESVDNLAAIALPSNLAYVLYTSGSTGRPKGVAIEHRSTVAFLCWARQTFSAVELAGVLASTSICFDLSIFELLAPLSWGGTTILVDDLLQLPSNPARDRVTLINTVPSIMSELLRHHQLPASVRTVNLAGEALPLALVRDVLRHQAVQQVNNLYGPTEDTVYSTWVSVRGDDGTTPTIGRPIANTQVYLLDGALIPVPIGIPGEIYLAGAGLARGYVNREDLTHAKFVVNPFSPEPGARMYRSGDLGRYRPDGQIEYLGRIDHQIKIHGHRIELGEIASVIRQHPITQECVVIARQDKSGDTRIVAYVACKPALHLSAQEAREQLHTHLKTWLPTFMVPTTLEFLESFPRTLNGKIDRDALPSPAEPMAAREREESAPTTLMHHQMRQIWEELLDVHPIGIRDDFFELGGHSLLAIRLIHEIERATGKHIPLSTLFTNSTIDTLVQSLQRQLAGPSVTLLVPIQPSGTKQALFFAHGDQEGSGMYCRRLARALGLDRPFYALQPHGLCGLPIPHSIKESAADYIELIRKIQPTGPYLLGGFCDGGLVAFEMAQQLRAQDETVEQLILIDVGAGSTHRRRGRTLIEAFGRTTGMSLDMQRTLYVNLRRRRNRMRGKLRARAASRLSAILSGACRLLPRKRQHGSILPHTPGESPSPTSEIEQDDLLGIYWWANAGYQPQPYTGSAAMFWAEDETVDEEERGAWKWEEVIADYSLHLVPGSHYTCITSQVQELAASIRLYLADEPDHAFGAILGPELIESPTSVGQLQ
ncbi:MAG: amino acid adenylation domain-containing protein [Chloroflexota bacterium]